MTLSDHLVELHACLPARRGNLYEQYYEQPRSGGGTRRHGPYYVWTRCEQGKMVSSRVAREDVQRVRQEIARGKRLAVLIDQLWKRAEEMAAMPDDFKKKTKSGRSKQQHGTLSRPR
jgi:hypothetical protein